MLKLRTNIHIVISIFPLALFLSGCLRFNSSEQNTAIYEITKIVDAETNQPIENTHLVVTIEREGSETIEILEEGARTTTIAVPVNYYLRVLVEAPGYKDWEVFILVEEAKTIEMPIEMEPAPYKPEDSIPEETIGI